MNDSELLLDTLRVLHLQLLSAAQQIGVILELAERPVVDIPDLSECPHPVAKRQPSPAMGHPTRFRCGVCNVDVEG